MSPEFSINPSPFRCSIWAGLKRGHHREVVHGTNHRVWSIPCLSPVRPVDMPHPLLNSLSSPIFDTKVTGSFGLSSVNVTVSDPTECLVMGISPEHRYSNPGATFI
ncbi:ral guanine nucleotide dissociation stimulator [Platysternon megacephalum]|uniref:Ral guanine nucleotide dissociation stimulator n=1 Tax=Platysternon megacephalum TaxID=55544 RepID=A0A4D9DHU9_9SAUR|nr:ral guanine nucleotide dissociation stimulator [Platysternon megacephalum]